jgi:DNA polymerase III, epsilon subunit and related 3''-5'' exonucleases
MTDFYHPFPIDRNKAIQRAQEFLAGNPLILDSETTGLDSDSDICEIAILDATGAVVLDTLVRTLNPIPQSASEIHGITNEMVQTAPTFYELMPELERILRNREVLVYNAEFDERMLELSARSNRFEFAKDNPAWWWSFPDGTLPGSATPRYRSYWHCVMKLYAKFYGDWNDYRGNYRWISLARAAGQCGLELPTNVHRAHADAELTRRIVLFMAEQQLEATDVES